MYWSGECPTNTPPNTHWNLNINSGGIESGSSGSPLINNDHRVIGQAHGQHPSWDNCAPTYALYGKFSWSWSGNGNNANTKNLQPWLDPNNTNVQTLDGLDYCNIVTNYHSNCQISGSTSITACTTPVTYNLIGTVLSNCGVRWEVSPNLQIIGSSKTNAIVTPIGVGAAWIKVHIFKGPDCEVVLQHNITISNPVSTQTSYSNTVINQTQVTWNSDALLGGTITINPSCTLTITSSIYCFPNSKIIVEPGGKLVIDGGTITKLCGTLWNGILVVGNKNQRQLAQYQGTVETKNGARIEYSKNAICTWDGTDYNTTGGIIKASNTTFSNNIKSIEFKEYINYNIVGGVTNNISYINNCNFTIDNGLLLYTSSYLNSHIVFQGIRGIKVSGTEFNNESTNQNNIGYGIYSNSSGFTVTESCSTGLYNSTNCTCTGTTTSSSFDNLNTCIKVLNDGNSTNTITVKHSEFEDFYDGINISATNNFFITQSSFKLQSGTIFGIKLQNCTGYKIEENNFFSNYFYNPAGSTMTGIYVNNSGTSENLIYRNTFTNVYKGITTYGTNGRSSLPYSGLQFKCNVFQNTFYSDIYCNSIIRRDQGNSSIGADNDFMKGFALDDYYKNLYYPTNIPQINYYFSTHLLHDPTTTTNVNKINGITTNNCASTLCKTFIIIIPKSLSFNNSNTNELVFDEGLIDLETYESLHNTYSLLVEDFIESDYCFLVENNFNNIDADIIYTVNQDLDSISHLSFLMKNISDRNINSIMVDSIFDIHELNGWYQRVDALSTKYFLANNYFGLQEFDNVWNILDNIPVQFELSIEEQTEYGYFRTFNTLRENVFMSNRNYWQLDSIEIATLETISELSDGYSGSLAKNILCFYYKIGCLDENVIEDDFIQERNITDLSKNAIINDTFVYVYPNPTKENVNVLFNTSELNNVTIALFNIVGHKVLSSNLYSQTNIIDVSLLPAGVYYYTISTNNATVHRGKLIKE
ncbi:MAG: T9SS type A sorting domain-containing protein [Bacteroidales bacterium]|nr:T9SS type A sorting domain-containing protein [Bacteroidales bacterium]